MKLDLTGKSALVTGGTRGIGRAIVETLGRAGAKVAFTYRSSAETAEALKADLEAEGIEVLALQGDAAQPDHAEETVQAVLDAWGSLDVLVCNAGVTRDNLLIRMSEDDWNTVIETNLRGVFHFCKAAYRPMMKQRGGSIITISSALGLTGNVGQANYAASKAGVIGFTKTLARELASRDVRANIVAPGYIATDMTAAVDNKVRDLMVETRIPFKRAGTPDDVAALVLFLASEKAAYITGQTMHVDGGLVM